MDSHRAGVLTATSPNFARGASSSGLEAMIRYYSEAGPDYAEWSPRFNMHFGYLADWTNLFDREAMLEQMNRLVTRPLEGLHHVLDMGCGLGATARSLASRSPSTKLTGSTVVPWQIQRARQLCAADSQVRILERDYTATDFDDETFDGAYAIESLCHGPGRDKSACIREAWRVLRPGGLFCVADGFLKQHKPLRLLLAASHARLCECWGMETLAVLPAFVACLQETGFGDVRAEEISWRVAPSVAHAPFVTARFLVREVLLKRQSLSRERWNNLLAAFLTMIVGLARGSFGYFLVTAVKKA